MAATMPLEMSWSDQGTSFRLDLLSLIVAIGLHIPLLFVKFESHKKDVTSPTTVLNDVTILDQMPKAPVIPAPPPPAPVVAKPSWADKLKAMVRKEPPPPPPPPKAPEKPATIVDAKPIIPIAPKLDSLPKVAPTLQGKSGFNTQADPKLVEEQKLKMMAPAAGIAPISERRLGVQPDRGAVKDKGSFRVASNESLRGIGGSGPSVSDPTAPAIKIQAGGAGSRESFSAPAAKSDKGHLSATGAPGLASADPGLGFRDKIIARDATPAQIAMGSRGGVAGGIPGGVAGGVKQDAGHFQGSAGGSVGGVPGGVLGGNGSAVKAIAAPAKPVQKKSMFTITGPLKDRKIDHLERPQYPAREQAAGIEASVVLEFTVEPDGHVKDNIVVRRTSGYKSMDDAAMNALRKWKFVPLADGENIEQVGQITINYTLS